MKRIILTFLASMPFFLCQAQNLLNNVDFQRLYGPYPMDWGRNLALFPHAVELLPGQGPQKQNAVRLDLSEMISYSQGGLRLVPGEQYEIGAWVRTKDFHAERSGIIIYNHGWFDEAGVIPVPADTDGEWVKVTATVICPPPNARKRSYFASSVYYSFSIYATGAAGQLDAASPFLIPLSDKAKEFSRHGVSLLDNVRLVPVSPRLEELPSKDADIDFYWPNSPDGEVRCTIYFCNGISVQKTGKLSDHRVKLHFPCLQAGPGILSAEVDRETGEGFLPAGDYAVNVLDLTPEPPIRRLNNLVSEIACRETAPGRYAFSFAEGGWMYLKTKAPEICVDGRALSGFTVDGWNEFMYRVPAGMHEITLDPAAGPPESLRKIPEIQMFAFDSKEYKEDFWKKHLLENITSPSVSSAWNPGRISRDFLLEIQRSGRSLPVNGGFHARKKYDPLQIANELRHCRGTLFGSSRQYDELDPGSPAHMVYAFAEAFWQLQDMKKPVYLWAQKGGKFFSPQWHASLISAVSNAAGGQGRILNEAYCRLWSDEKRMEEALSKYRDSVAFAKEFCPDYPKNMLMTAGAYFNPEGTILLVSNPECDPKVGMDLFYRMCAVDPVFEGLYGIGVYSIDSTDEEMVRWFGKLFRHYGIEGQKDLLSKKYGFRLKTEYLKNCDFTEGLEHWMTKGDVRAGVFEGLGKMQGRGLEQEKAGEQKKNPGDTAAVLTPGSSVSQTATGLIPGRRYSVTCIVAERKMVEVGKKDNKIKPEIDITLSHADQTGISKKHAAGFLTVKIVFTAKEDQTDVRFSVPAGQTEELVLNYVAVRPYFSGDAGK